MNPGKPLRALIVEDSADDTNLLLRHLRNVGGFEVDHRRVETAEQMTTALNERAWDLVLSDYTLPSFSGPAALEIWKRFGTDIPFVVITSTIGDERAVALMKGGAHDFILKDNLERLVPVIDRELREASNRQRTREMEVERVRLIKELQRLIQVRDEFLSIATHELKTPLTSIKLAQQRLERLLAQDHFDPSALQKLRSMAHTCGHQIEHLIQLAEQLLDVSRVSSGAITIEFKPNDLTEVVGRAIRLLRPQAEAAKSEIEFQPGPPIPGDFDAIRIFQVVSNLVANAIKFGAGKPIRVTLSGDTHRALISVTDSGIGVSIEDQSRIFERFERAVSARNYGGLGLGLYISRQILAAHNGSIRVDSKLGAGSTFTVELPLSEQARKSGASEPAIEKTKVS